MPAPSTSAISPGGWNRWRAAGVCRPPSWSHRLRPYPPPRNLRCTHPSFGDGRRTCPPLSARSPASFLRNPDRALRPGSPSLRPEDPRGTLGDLVISGRIPSRRGYFTSNFSRMFLTRSPSCGWYRINANSRRFLRESVDPSVVSCCFRRALKVLSAITEGW